MELGETHPALGEYLRYTRHTESPVLFHAWAFLSGVSAALGHRCYYEFGTYTTLPNMFVVLCGPASVRKSSAIDPIKNLLRKNTAVRFAPSDTGGQRQGLIEAMLGNEQEEDSDVSVKKSGGGEVPDSLEELYSDEIEEKIGEFQCDTRDPNTMFIAESKLTSLLGENNIALLTFLQKLYDGEDYTYRLKHSLRMLSECCIGMLAATTASSFAQAITNIVYAQDFMARCVFVYADETSVRKVTRPMLDQSLRGKFSDLFREIFDKFNGKFKESDAAKKCFDDLYLRGISLVDQRFTQYVQRRQTHLQKVSMALAAARKSMMIEDFDVEAADGLLALTEDGMPFALGEYGLSKASSAKAAFAEMICSTTQLLPLAYARSIMARDMTAREVTAAIEELVAANRIRYYNGKDGTTYVMGVSSSDAASARKKKQAETNALLREIRKEEKERRNAN